MRVFNRNILKDLERWKIDPQRKPLILRGARQVGKTTIVTLLATRFDQFLYFNLEKVEESRIFKEIDAFDRLLEALFYQKNKSREGGATLIFIDEIQEAPEAIAKLRYFFEEAPDLYVIAAGSLLGNITS